MRCRGLISLSGILLLLSAGITIGSCREKLPLVRIEIGDEIITAEVALTREERQRGLMRRRELPRNRGMLFVFPYDQRLSFWMKNTNIPLSVAFLSKEGEIKEIRELEPHSLKPVESRFSVRYALECNRGLFQELGVASGDTVRFLDPLPSKVADP